MGKKASILIKPKPKPKPKRERERERERELDGAHSRQSPWADGNQGLGRDYSGTDGPPPPQVLGAVLALQIMVMVRIVSTTPREMATGIL